MSRVDAEAVGGPSLSGGATRGRRLLTGLLAGFAYGACLLLAAEPVGWWPVTFAAVLPLVWVAMRVGQAAGAVGDGRGVKRTALGVCLGAMPAWGYLHWHLWITTSAGFVPLVVYFGTLPALYVWMVARWSALRAAPATSGRRPIAARVPAAVVVVVLWMGLEYARGEYLLGGYAWFGVGQPLIATLWAYLATLGGEYAVAMVALLPAAALAGGMTARAEGRGAGVTWACVASAGAALTLSAWLAGPRRGPADGVTERPELLSVAVVQTSVPQSNKQRWPIDDRVAAMRRWMALTTKAAGLKANLIVWPETMFPAPFPGNGLNPDALAVLEASPAAVDYAAWAKVLTELQQRLDVPMLVGAVANEGLKLETGPDGKLADATVDRQYNSVHLIENGRVSTERYDKVRLMPFGETIPLLWRWPALQNWFVGLGARGMSFNLSRGFRPTVWTIDGVGIAAPICFETSYGFSCRRLIYDLDGDGRRRAAIMINVSNDGWFHGSAWGRQGFVTASRWRCIETGVPMVRAANTGLSVAIDGWGRMLAIECDPPAAREGAEGLIVARLRRADVAPTTLYAATGDIVGPVSLAGGLVLSGAVLLGGRGRRGRATSGGPEAQRGGLAGGQ